MQGTQPLSLKSNSAKRLEENHHLVDIRAQESTRLTWSALVRLASNLGKYAIEVGGYTTCSLIRRSLHKIKSFLV